MTDWPKRTLVFDTETTGVDVFNDRIVQLFIGIADENGDLIEKYEWIINPGVDVPEEASNVHGFTTEYLKAHGHRPGRALSEALDVFDAHDGIPWVAYNLAFDLSILSAEYERLDLAGFGNWEAKNVQLIDGLVIDRHKDKYRKGKRKLENMAAHYGIPFDPDAAHKADYDVEVTAKVTRAIVNKYGLPTNQEQAAWYKSWASGLEDYLRRSDPTATVDGNWPLKLKEN